MWAMFSTRVRRWVLIFVGLPLIVRLLDWLATRAEERRGPGSKTAGALRSSSGLLDKARPRRRRKRGLFRRR